MNNRLIAIIAAACTCVTGACSKPLEAKGAVAVNVDEWVCTRDKNGRETGQCNPIKIRDSLPEDVPPSQANPKPDHEVRHLARGAKFRLIYESEKQRYLLSLANHDWLAPFFALPPLKWDEGYGLLPDKLCTSEALTTAAPAKAPATAKSTYARFATDSMPLHISDDLTFIEHHTLYIYPIEPERPGEHVYCLSFRPIEGGSHNGAVHADP